MFFVNYLNFLTFMLVIELVIIFGKNSFINTKAYGKYKIIVL